MDWYVYVGILLIIIGIVIWLFIRKQYILFLMTNSVAINNLLSINKEYIFYDGIDDYYVTHTYDNVNFFNNITCEDYLIYMLQFNKKITEIEIKNIAYNRNLNVRYRQKIDTMKIFGEYTTENDKLNKKYLLILEKRIFNKNIIKPKTQYNAYVKLYFAKMNGRISARKEEIFNSQDILYLINRLGNKTHGFYNDRGIWDAICRVERGKVSNKMRFSIYKRDGYRCRKCGRTQSSDYLEIDHIKPISKGGKSTYDNLQTLCRRCNKEKGDKY